MADELWDPVLSLSAPVLVRVRPPPPTPSLLLGPSAQLLIISIGAPIPEYRAGASLMEWRLAAAMKSKFRPRSSNSGPLPYNCNCNRRVASLVFFNLGLLSTQEVRLPFPPFQVALVSSFCATLASLTLSLRSLFHVALRRFFLRRESVV